MNWEDMEAARRYGDARGLQVVDGTSSSPVRAAA